jgi:plasmid stability protein
MTWMDTMAGLLVCDVSVEDVSDVSVEDVSVETVPALKERADARGRSEAAEHREILAAALLGPHKRSFAEMLASMPDVGEDADFERVQSKSRPRPVIEPSPSDHT